MPSGQVVSIALDACDPPTAIDFANRGAMPNLARMLREGSRSRVDNPYGLLVGAIWASYATSLRPARHGFYCWDRINPANYERELSPPRLAHLPAFWKRMSDRGCSVAVVDVPHRLPCEPLDGFEIAEWGCHDRHHGFRSSPPSLADRIAAEYGLHPIFGIDPYAARDFAPDDWTHRAGAYRTLEEDKALLTELLEGAAIKQRLVGDLLHSRDWNFFAAVFGESHAIGHQQWHLHDPNHPRHDRDTVAALGGDPVEQVYARLDDAIGAMAEASGEDALFIVHLSHGMGVHFDVTHLLEEVLTRLDLHDRSGLRSRLRDRTVRAASPLIAPVRRIARAIALPARVRQKVAQSMAFSDYAPSQVRARQRYFAEPNNTVYGGIRLNLIGREPQGCVPPEEIEAICAKLEADLLDIVDCETGEPVIQSVVPCTRHHQRTRDDAMPDLFVEWTRRSQVAAIRSPKIGTIVGAYRGWRTGDHRPDGLLVARGPGMEPGREMPSLAVEDIGPSIAARFGITLDGLDGRAVEWLAKSRAEERTA